MAAEIPLVGRTLELERIVSRLSDSTPSAFVVTGAAGVGKSRLAAEAARVAVGLGQATAQVVATRAASSIPFGTFAPLLPEPDSGSAGLFDLLRRASDAIVARAGPDGRLLLVVDDAHLLDDGSAALVHQLAQTGSCSLLANVRIPGRAPDPVTALWKDDLAERIDLDPLTPAGVEEFAAHVLGGALAGATVRRLWDASAGNALYLRELLRGAVESGALTDEGGVWMLRRPLTAPDRLVELVATRLADLPPETLEVADLLALGEPLALNVLEELTSAQAVEDAERRALIAVGGESPAAARLGHPVYGEVLRRRLPRTRQRRLWATLATGLEATGTQRREDLLQIARWQLDAGVRTDPALLGRAAKWAQQMFDLDLAARLARAAFESGGGIDAGLVLGEAEFRSGRLAEAEQVLAGLVPLCTTDSESARVAGARMYNLGTLMGDRAGAEAIVADVLAEVSDPVPRLQLIGRLATSKLLGGEPQAALLESEPLLESGDDETVGRGAFIASFALGLLGRSEEAVKLAEQGFELRRRGADEIHLPESQFVGAITGLAAAGRLAEAERYARRAYEACIAGNDREGQASFSVLRGLVHVEQGALARAAQAFREGAGINREIQDLGAARWCVAGVVLAVGMAGDDSGARSALAELDAFRPDWMMVFEPDLIDRGRAWAAVSAGTQSTARDLLMQSVERAQENHQWAAESRLLHDIARLGRPESVVARLRELSNIVEGDFVVARAEHAAALAHGSAAELGAVVERFESLGALLLAAEAATAAAAGYRSDGLVRQSNAFARKAAELSAACGDVRTPALEQREEVDPLTEREREVAGLAASGLSSKEIAARLFVSVRTVDNHLQRVYGKLGLTNREELVDAMNT